MPLALLVIGALAIITGIKGNQAQVLGQFESDLTGSGGFIYWIAAIVVFAIFGRVAGLSSAAKMFIALILVVYVVAQNGLWAQATAALAGLSTANAASGTPTVTIQPSAALTDAGNLPVPPTVGASDLPAAPTLH
jgi:hypothetical protein